MKDTSLLSGLSWTLIDEIHAVAENFFELEKIELIIWKLALGGKKNLLHSLLF